MKWRYGCVWDLLARESEKDERKKPPQKNRLQLRILSKHILILDDIPDAKNASKPGMVTAKFLKAVTQGLPKRKNCGIDLNS